MKYDLLQRSVDLAASRFARSLEVACPFLGNRVPTVAPTPKIPAPHVQAKPPDRT
ncbi:MAG: hypothetical protein LC776_15135 [Acidobacteria bacterium]|nr:hypothetical protein [Acidobacteriota bacterium]